MISDATLSIGVQASVKLSTLAHQLASTPQPRYAASLYPGSPAGQHPAAQVPGGGLSVGLVGGACAEGKVAGL